MTIDSDRILEADARRAAARVAPSIDDAARRDLVRGEAARAKAEAGYAERLGARIARSAIGPSIEIGDRLAAAKSIDFARVRRFAPPTLREVVAGNPGLIGGRRRAPKPTLGDAGPFATIEVIASAGQSPEPRTGA